MRAMLLSLLLGWASLEVSAAELPDFRGIVEASGPAVVNVEAAMLVDLTAEMGEMMPDDDTHGDLPDLLERFFGERDPDEPLVHETQSTGSGFIISDDGYIITNHHVVAGASRIVVRLKDRRELTARLVGLDRPSDIALLKVDEQGLPTVELGRSDATRVGEWVVAIGSPFNFDHSVTAGIVSAKGRSFADQQYVPFIQSDVPINRGNSGGPLINMRGEVIGVNSQIYSENGAYMGLSFAIPIEVALSVVEQLKAGTPVRRGLLGVGIEDVNRDLAGAIGLDEARGAIVTYVQSGSAAERAGIEPWDVILSFNGQPVSRFSDLPPIVGMTPPGTDAEVVLFRDGHRQRLSVDIGEFRSEESVPEETLEAGEEAPERFGLQFETTDEDSPGLRVTGVAGLTARRAGFRVGDLVLSVNRTPVSSLGRLDELLEEAGAGPVAFLVQRGRGTTFVVVQHTAGDG